MLNRKLSSPPSMIYPAAHHSVPSGPPCGSAGRQHPLTSGKTYINDPVFCTNGRQRFSSPSDSSEMIDWQSPQIQQKALDVFVKFLHGLFGLYIWELLLTSNIEWLVLTGKKPFRWPLFFYFASRYCTLGSLIAGIAMFDIPSVSCHAAFTATLVLTHMSLGLASINLAVRTIAIWAQSKYVSWILCFIIVGQWSLIVVQATTVSTIDLPGGGCMPETKNFKWVTAIYVYSLGIDSIVIFLNIWKLRGGLGMRSATFTHVIFRQGIFYYMIAFLFDFVAIVILILNLNLGMVGLFSVIAQVTCSIVAGRAVRSLATSITLGQNTKKDWSRSNPISNSLNKPQVIDLNSPSAGQVVIQMETATHRDSFSKPDDRSRSNRTIDFDIEIK
ncbi:hypothetical protein CPB83DRAFT_616449 [Crepidotus variabilis]|uniref:Uncharacterized protein n=1 Tax=Crepidotus variabilis TaxID=179855 RepID=A0A9P6E8E4_9AGAR|nr:hypothetical protein CPB83DRAFT_616449 [Crepidotus variabilis]